MERLTPREAAERLRPTDTLGIPLGTGQPPALLEAPSTAEVGGETISRIVPWFGAGAVITTPRHQIDILATEHGVAELQGKTVHQRGEALASVAHPAFRDQLREAAERASHGFSPRSDRD